MCYLLADSSSPGKEPGFVRNAGKIAPPRVVRCDGPAAVPHYSCPHEMPNDAPDHTEAVTEPFDGLNQALPGGLYLRFQLLKLGVQGGEQVLHRWHDVLRRNQVKTGQGRRGQQRVFFGLV